MNLELKDSISIKMMALIIALAAQCFNLRSETILINILTDLYFMLIIKYLFILVGLNQKFPI